MKTLAQFLLLFACIGLLLTPAAFADDAAEAEALHEQAFQLMRAIRYREALPIAQKALELREKALGPDHLDTVKSLDLLATAYHISKDYAKEEPLRRRALKIRENKLGPDDLGTAIGLDNLGFYYKSIYDYAKAEPLYRRALKIRENKLGPDDLGTATSLYGLAAIYEQGMLDLKNAEEMGLRALAITEAKLGPDDGTLVSNILTWLGGLYCQTRDYAKAELMIQRGLANREKKYGPKFPLVASSLGRLSGLYMAKGDYVKAEPLLKRALNIVEERFDPDYIGVIRLIGSLIAVNIDLGRQTEAVSFALRVDQADEKVLGNILSFTSEQQRSTFQKTTSPYNMLASLGQAPALAQTILRRKGVVLDSLLEDKLVAEASNNPNLLAILSQVRAAKQRLMQLILEAPTNPSEQAREKRAAEKETLSKQVEELEATLARQVAGLGRARRALSTTVSQVQAALTGEQVLIELIRYSHYIGKNAWEMRYGAVVIGHTGEPKWTVLGKAEEIEKNLKLYSKLVRPAADGTGGAAKDRGMKVVGTEAGGETSLTALLQTLHQQLWTPIEKLLPAGTKTVILSPDGELNFLSFATLLTPDDHFLCEKYSICYVASGRDLLREFRMAAKPTMSIYGNPDFAASPVSSGQPPAVSAGIAMRSLEMRDFSAVVLPPLPGTQQEGIALAAQLKQAGMQTELFLGPQATEAQLRQVNGPRILHLATHGFFLPDTDTENRGMGPNQRGMSVVPLGGNDPMGDFDGGRSRPVALKNPMHRSGLALAGAQRTLEAWARGEVPPTDNDGILTAEEVGGLKLAGTWLVALSACETGVGEARAGEGVLGLRRGFIQAGAQNLLMTLWPVSDDITVQVMQYTYYQAQKLGGGPAALATAQKEWLVHLRKTKDLWFAVNRAGPFIMSFQGPVSGSATAAQTTVAGVDYQVGQCFTNTLGMIFVPVPGTEVLFSIWDTRVQDYQAFVAGTGHSWEKPSFEQGPTHPAVNVSWEDAKAFCKWLTEKECGEGRLKAEQEYRLPTDAEWSAAAGLTGETGGTPKEKAAKTREPVSGHRWARPWGKEQVWPPLGTGNFAGEEVNRVETPSNYFRINSYRDDYPRTSPVGSFKANHWGLYDMSGNVRQWCEDMYDSGSRNKNRVVRGSSWRVFSESNLLLNSRDTHSSRFRDGDCGFRCVVTGMRKRTCATASFDIVTRAVEDAFVKSVPAMQPEQQVLAVIRKLKELNPQFDGKETHKIEGGVVTMLSFSTVGVNDISPVKALQRLRMLNIAPPTPNQKGWLYDLLPLSEMQLKWLWCHNNPITDLSPLKGMPLTVLSVSGTRVCDLSPLAGMKLEVLSFNDTAVSDLSPLAGMPLSVLWCNDTKVADIAPLKGMSLKELRCDLVPARDAEVLKTLPTLKQINNESSLMFWKRLRIPDAAGLSPDDAKKDPKIALRNIYQRDSNIAESFKKLLDEAGFVVHLISSDDLIGNTNITSYAAFLIGSDRMVGLRQSLEENAWMKTVDGTRKPILGLGEAGAAFFGALKLNIISPLCWYGHKTGIVPANYGKSPFWSSSKLVVKSGEPITVYWETSHVGAHQEKSSEGVSLIGAEQDSNDHFPILQQGSRYVLWGFSGAPDQMTSAGKQLFIAICRYTVNLNTTRDGNTLRARSLNR